MENIEKHIKRLWLAYAAYHKASNVKTIGSDEYATACTNDFIEYLRKCTQDEGPKYNWGDWSQAIENQIRILIGFIECYDKPIIRDKVTHKTRWSV